jgi:hypothetical protein
VVEPAFSIVIGVADKNDISMDFTVAVPGNRQAVGLTVWA